MVGVAGRSKGCFTCRNRRVKCDEGRPECERCKKAKRVCGGYREIDFIDGLPSRVRKEAEKTSGPPVKRCAPLEDSSDASSSSSSSEAGSSRASSKTPVSLSADTALVPVARRRRLDGDSPLDSVPLSLNSLAFEDLIYLSYTQDNLMKGGTSIGYTDVGRGTGRGEKLVHGSLLSLSTVFFGLKHHQKKTMQTGMQRYGSTLKSLNKALADPELSKDLAVLKAIMILGIYEFLLPTSPLGWIEHFLGIERLIVYRGPQAHCMSPARDLFEAVRSIIVFASLSLDRPSPLAHPDWKTIPWILEPESKPQMQYLYDILFDIPAIFLERDRLIEESTKWADISDDCAAVEDQMKGMKALLDAWWEKWWAKHQLDVFEVDEPGSLKPEDGAPLMWDRILHFTSLNTAHEYAVYNGTRIILSTVLRSILALDPTQSPLALANLAAEARHAAIEICRSIDYHLLDYQMGAGSLYLLFPLRMAWQGMSGSSTREGRWIEEVTQQISKGTRGWWESASAILLEPMGPPRVRTDLSIEDLTLHGFSPLAADT